MRGEKNNIDHKNREYGVVISIDDFVICLKDVQENHWQIYQDQLLYIDRLFDIFVFKSC
jgi:hypothetical protein